MVHPSEKKAFQSRRLILVQALALIVCSLLYLCTPLAGQTDINDVHVLPRPVAKNSKDAKDPNDNNKDGSDSDEIKALEAPAIVPVSATANTASQPPVNTPPAVSAHLRPMKVDVDLVLVPVTITDPMNRLVTGLEKDNFQLYEGSAQ